MVSIENSFPVRAKPLAPSRRSANTVGIAQARKACIKSAGAILKPPSTLNRFMNNGHDLVRNVRLKIRSVL